MTVSVECLHTSLQTTDLIVQLMQLPYKFALVYVQYVYVIFFFKQKTAYEM